MNSVPLKNPLVKWKEIKSGNKVAILQRRSDWWGKILAFIFVIPKEREVVLDELGSEVVDLCDGINKVEDLVQKMADKYKLTRKEAETSILSYLRQLVRRGIIGLQIKEIES